MLIIVPTKRINQINHVLENFKRQQLDIGDELLIVVNNASLIDYQAALKERGYPVELAISSSPGTGAALAYGVEIAKARGHATWMCMDDDDWYGSKAALLVKEALKDHDYCGRTNRYVCDKGKVFLLSGISSNQKPLCSTIGARTDVTALFENVPNRPGPEDVWTNKMRAAGRSYAILSPEEFIQIRYANPAHAHEWDVPFDVMTAIVGATVIPVS